MSTYLLNKYKPQGLDQSQIELIIGQETPRALATYQALPSPLMSKHTYLEYWLEEILIQTTAASFVHNSSRTHDYQKAVAAVTRFLTNSPSSSHKQDLHPNSSTTRPESNQTEVLESLENLIKQRHHFAKLQGYANYLELVLASEGIDQKACQTMEANIRKILKNHAQDLHATRQTKAKAPRSAAHWCAVCETTFPLENLPSQMIEIATKQDQDLAHVQDRIKIHESNANRTSYSKDTDTIDIELDMAVSPKHQSLNLLHELGHASFFARCFRQQVNPLSHSKYQHELAATALEVNSVRSLGTEIYQAFVYETLPLWIRLCVELAIYTNPDQDLEQVYGKCYAAFSHSSNRPDSSFLFLDPSFVYKPLSSLGYGLGLFSALK